MMFAVIKKIPQILENPTLVLKSKDKADGKQNTRLVMFGSVKGKHGAPVMCVLDLRPVEKGFVIDGVQKVNSAYVKDSGPIQFVRNRSYHLTTQRKRSFFPNRQSQYRICKRWAEILYADPGYSQKGKTTAQLEAENRKLRESLEITRELPQSTPPQKLLIYVEISGLLSTFRSDIIDQVILMTGKRGEGKYGKGQDAFLLDLAKRS